MSFQACAIMSTFNESDILEESIRKLVEQGIDVFLIDNGSSDGTQAIAKKFLDKGVIGIETCIFHENGKEVYDWTCILRLKEEISSDLNYDWFLHVDADEIRYSPWRDKSLLDGIHLVDEAGFNLINFRLFNFRLTDAFPTGPSIEESMQYYSHVEQFNRMQVKAWKKNKHIDLVSHGGHLALVPNPKIFPIRFIHKHYPVRSLEQGTRKILKDRLGRYSQSDRAKQWHVQYDHLNTDLKILEQELLCNSQDLKRFEREEIANDLFLDATKILSFYANGSDIENFVIDKKCIERVISNGYHLNDEIKNELLQTIRTIVQELKLGKPVELDLNKETQQVVTTIYNLIESQAMADFMRGDPLLFDNLKLLTLNRS